MRIEDFFNLLEGVKPSGSGWTALCPAHDDHNPSLSIIDTERKIQVTCFANCPIDAICSAIGCEVKDLYHDNGAAVHAPARPGWNGKRIEAKYDYLDETGTLLYQAVRYSPKGFSQRRPDGKGGWAWNLEGVRRVLYRLPELIGSEPRRGVFLVEGEKDADRLADWGLIATTNPQGAGKWRDEYSECLRGRTVYILPDNDSPGRSHADAVARSLQGIAESVKTIDLPGLPPKGDVSEWIDAGGSKKALRELCKNAPIWTPPPVGIVQPGASGAGFSEAYWPDPQPLPNDLPPVADLDPDMLPDAFRDWTMDTAERMQTPPDYHAAAAIVAAASLIGRRCGIYPKRVDNWFVIPNLWGGCVGRPGAKKTPAIKAALKPLYILEREAVERYKTELKDFALEKQIHEAKRVAFKKRMQEAANKGKSLDGLRHEAPADLEEPKPRRYISNDPTVEKLGELLCENQNGLLLFRDELTGWLRNLDHPNRGGDRAFYLESWPGDQSFNVDRIGRGSIHIPALCLSIFGGIQPGPLGEYVLATLRGGAGDDGLLPRFQVLVWPDVSPDWRNVDRLPDSEVWARSERVFRRLNDPAWYPEAEGKVHGLRFTAEAQETFGGWREELEKRLKGGNLPPVLESHLAKYGSLYSSLALIFELIDGEDFPGAVGDRAALRALTWVEYLESHARRVYGIVDADREAIKELTGRIEGGAVPDGMTVRDLTRKNWRGLGTPERVGAALEGLTALGWLRVDRPIPGGQGGRPSETIRLNPVLRREAAA